MRIVMLGVPIDAVTRSEALERIKGFLEGSVGCMVTTPNPEMLVQARRNSRFRRVLQRADLAVPDGVGLVFMSRFQDVRIPERVTGTDLVDDVCAQAARAGKKVFFLGGERGEAKGAADVLRERYPSLEVVGAVSGGYVARNEKGILECGEDVLRELRDACPDILFVAFGHGKQEEWILQNLPAMPSVRVAMGIGGAFNFISGRVRRAPKLVRKAGLEWLWRLMREPGRIMRILRAVIVFPFLALTEKRCYHKRMIRVRFAPSPTGFLHIGGLRTALYNELFAMRHGGVLVLRIEDTDRSRMVEGGVENIVRTLAASGIEPAEGPYLDDDGALKEKGEFGPYVQSGRLEIYRKHAEELIAAGNAYRCFCTSERLEEVRARQVENKAKIMYDKHCRGLSDDDVRKKVEAGEPYVVRLKVPSSGATDFKDEVRGEVSFGNATIDDQVLLKSDGYPTYHLANVVDDHLMGITHVIRGEEWLPSTPKHVLLYRAFGWEAPAFAHLPLLLNPDRSKLSKRQGDVAVEDYLAKGYLPDALINFVALLGWNPTADREIYSKEELAGSFDLAKVNSGGAVLNTEKLDWLNRQYMKRLSDEDFYELALPFLLESDMLEEKPDGFAGSDGTPASKEKIMRAVSLEKERMNTLSGLPEAVSFFFTGSVDLDIPKIPWKKSTPDAAKEGLDGIRKFLASLPEGDFDNPKALEEKVIAYIEESGWTNADTLWPARYALTGREKSPGPFEVAWVLGRETTLKRLDNAIKQLS